MSLEQTLSGWTAPSSDTEQERQDRTERMVREAVEEHRAFADCQLRVYAKGSYANNTNVRAESDVDIAVECTEAEYWEEASPGIRTNGVKYNGRWTPAMLRHELVAALRHKFSGGVDDSGSTAVRVHSSSARVDADVVPCFSYRYYGAVNSSRVGTRIFRSDGSSLVNYPEQQLTNGRLKNQRTNYNFKKVVRVLKRLESVLAMRGAINSLPSYFVECLAYNCPDAIYLHPSWTERVEAALLQMVNSLHGQEPTSTPMRWLEVNECFYLFHSSQKWKRSDGWSFALAAREFLGQL